MPPKANAPVAGENMPPVDDEVVAEAPKAKVSKGPKMGERGEYLPNSYSTPKGNTRTDC